MNNCQHYLPVFIYYLFILNVGGGGGDLHPDEDLQDLHDAGAEPAVAVLWQPVPAVGGRAPLQWWRGHRFLQWVPVLRAAGRPAPLLCPSAPGSTHSLSGKKVCHVVDPDPYVFEPPGSGSVSQRYGSGSGSRSWSFYHKANIVKPWFLLFCEFFRTFYL